MQKLKRKGFAYVTHANRLLVFRHPYHPQAGIQVPAGSLEPGETPAAGALREAIEETGLSYLQLGAFLGEHLYERPLGLSNPGQIHHRYFYHVICSQTPPESWRHGEFTPSEGTVQHVFEFFWVALPDAVPELVAGHGHFLGELCRVMGMVYPD